MNWYAMGLNAPSIIDDARGRAKATRVGDDYDERERRMDRHTQGLSRDGNIRAWRAINPTLGRIQ